MFKVHQFRSSALGMGGHSIHIKDDNSSFLHDFKSIKYLHPSISLCNRCPSNSNNIINTLLPLPPFHTSKKSTSLKENQGDTDRARIKFLLFLNFFPSESSRSTESQTHHTYYTHPDRRGGTGSPERCAVSGLVCHWRGLRHKQQVARTGLQLANCQYR